MTLSEMHTILDAYQQAELAILKGQSHTFNGRSVTLANLTEIRNGRQEWEKKIQLAGGKRRVRTVVLEPRA